MVQYQNLNDNKLGAKNYTINGTFCTAYVHHYSFIHPPWLTLFHIIFIKPFLPPPQPCPALTYLHHWVVHIYGRHGEFLFLGELIETMDACHTFLHYPTHTLGQGGVLMSFCEETMSGISTIVQNEVGSPSLGLQTLVYAPPEVLLRLITPCKYAQAWGRGGRSNMPLFMVRYTTGKYISWREKRHIIITSFS